MSKGAIAKGWTTTLVLCGLLASSQGEAGHPDGFGRYMLISAPQLEKQKESECCHSPAAPEPEQCAASCALSGQTKAQRFAERIRQLDIRGALELDGSGMWIITSNQAMPTIVKLWPMASRFITPEELTDTIAHAESPGSILLVHPAPDEIVVSIKGIETFEHIYILQDADASVLERMMELRGYGRLSNVGQRPGSASVATTRSICGSCPKIPQ